MSGSCMDKNFAKDFILKDSLGPMGNIMNQKSKGKTSECNFSNDSGASFWDQADGPDSRY